MRPLPSATGFVPDGDEAREWAEQELRDQVYEAAQPNALDRIAGAIADAVERLLNPDLSGAWSPLVALAVVLVVAGVLVAAFLVWGPPRASRRATDRSARLFDEDPRRSAADLRASSAAHAAAGAWDAAIADRFRALARSLEERDLLDAPPGLTAQRFAQEAAIPFPDDAADIRRAAAAFDDVRYLRRAGTAEALDAVARLDERLRATRPASVRGEVLA